jgi:hypothetical protein
VKFKEHRNRFKGGEVSLEGAAETFSLWLGSIFLIALVNASVLCPPVPVDSTLQSLVGNSLQKFG